jgi:peptidyl-tRNA hydrolase, PTH1 family
MKAIRQNLARLFGCARGSAGGHNGLKSIIATIGTDEFARIRLGVGKPESPGGQVDHVLGTFKPDELAAVKEAVVRGADAVEAVIESGIEDAMNRFNTSPSQRAG